MTADTETAMKEKVATACRVLANEGLVKGILGHVSARIADDQLLIRCRGPQERGLRHSTAEDVWTITTGGESVDLPTGYTPPKEAPIHTELMRRRPEVAAVVHAHPLAALLFGLAGLELRPIIGAYNIPALRLALDGLPVFPRPILISRPELAAELLDCMGASDTCLMVGHGIVVAGGTVEEAVVRAVDLNVLMDISVKMAQLGVTPDLVDPSDLEELPDLGSSFNAGLAWSSLVADIGADEGTQSHS